MKKKYNDIDFWKSIHNEYINGMSFNDIKKQYKIERLTILKYFKKFNLEIKTKEQVNKDKVNKIKRTCIKKYGVENPFQNEDIKKKIKDTNVKKYGVENPSQNEDIKKKIKDTNVKKYGVENPSQNEDIKKKKECTSFFNFGVNHPLQNEKIKEKVKNTNIKKYGVEYGLQNKVIREKIKKTNIFKYGVSTPSQNKKIKEKMKNTKVKKHFKLLLQKIKNEYELIDEFKGIHPREEKWISYKFKHLRCGHIFETPLYEGQPKCPKCYYHRSKSKLEDEIESLINSLGFKTERNVRILDKKEIDIFISEKNIGIEINSLYYHNSNPNFKSYKDRNYHKQKTDLAREKNIRLIHIWDCFNLDIYKSMIRNLLGKTKNKIYARKCDIKNITKEQEIEFLNNNHIHGYAQSIKSLGLFYNNELVSLISFRKHKEGMEIARFASKINTNVIGGFSKLLKYSNIKENIVTYCDIEFCPNKEDSVYYKNGFKFVKETNPKLYFTDFKQVYSRQEFMKHKLKDKLERYDENLTAEENLFMNDIYPVYSTGNWKFILNK